MQEAFTVLEQNRVGKHESKKVCKLCNKINTNNTKIIAARGSVRTSPIYRDDFKGAANHLPKIILMLFPLVAARNVNNRCGILAVNNTRREKPDRHCYSFWQS